VFVDRNVDDVSSDTGQQKAPIWLPGTGNQLALKVFPNPAPRQQTLQFNYYLPGNDYIQLRLVNARGEVVATLYHGFQYAGNYVISWPFGNRLSAEGGMYVVQLSARHYGSITQKLIIP